MVIKSLELTNYRRFRSQYIEFPENLLGFIGPNGVGKTTLLEAVAWALYGTRATRGSKVEIRSQGESPREICEVILIFELAGRQYKIVRQLRGKNAVVEAALYRSDSDEPLAVQEQGVNKLVEKLVGLDYRSFFASVYARQKDLSALGNMQPEERRQAINRLINIDAIDRARDLARQRKNQIDSMLKGMQAMIKDPEELKKVLASVRLEVQKEQEAEQLARTGVDAAQKAFEESKNEFEKLNRLRDRYHKIEAEIGKKVAEQEGTRRQLRDTLAELKKIEKSKNELQKLTPQRLNYKKVKAQKEEQDQLRVKMAQLRRLREEQAHQKAQVQDDEKIIRRLQKLVKETPDLKVELEKIDEQLAEIKKKIKGLQRDQEKRLHECGAVESKGKELISRREKIDELGRESPCPVCTRPLGEYYGQVRQHFEQEIIRLRDKWKDANARVVALKQKIEMAQTRRDELQKRRENLLEKIASLRNHQDKIKEAQQRQKRFQDKVSELQQEIDKIGLIDFSEENYQTIVKEFEKLARIHEHALQLDALVARQPAIEQQQKKLEKRQRDLDGAIHELNEKLASLGFDEKAHQEAKAIYEDRLEHLNRLRNTLLEASKALAAAQGRMENAEMELQRTLDQLKKTEELKQEALYLQALVEHFGRFRLHLASRLRPLIAARASDLLRLTTSGRYSLMELDEDYNIRIIDQGGAFPLHRFSGGEEDLANLCLRIAISQVVAERSGKAPVQFIVLDEVFGSQDTQRQNLILQALLQLQSQFRQIFIISHVESIQEILPVIFEVQMTGQNESRARMLGG